MTIDELKDHLDLKFADIDQRFKAEREYIDERTRDMETNLLRAFRAWATRIETHMKVHTALTTGLMERVAIVEERLDEMDEKRPH